MKTHSPLRGGDRRYRLERPIDAPRINTREDAKDHMASKINERLCAWLCVASALWVLGLVVWMVWRAWG